MHPWAIAALIFAITVLMIMSGRGGGNFYVIALLFSGVPVHVASTTSQFILIGSALAGSLIFGKAKTLSWPLFLFFGGFNASMAFFGGSLAHRFSGPALETVLAFALLVAGIAMFFPEREVRAAAVARFGYWNITEGESRYVVNLWLALPLTLVTGFFSGMVGISGGSFLVPLMVVGCGVPMRIAVGTATGMLAVTAVTGFAGNALQGGFDAALAVPCGIVAVAGGLIGGKIALETKPKRLKAISGAFTIAAAFVMLGRTFAR